MEITGIVCVIQNAEQITEKFKKRLIVIETDTNKNYPQLIPIELHGDKTSLADTLNIGQEIKVHIDLRGREYNGKYYPSILGWKIDAKEIIKDNYIPYTTANDMANDDLPF